MNIAEEMDAMIGYLNRLKNPHLDLTLDDIRGILLSFAEAIRELEKRGQP